MSRRISNFTPIKLSKNETFVFIALFFGIHTCISYCNYLYVTKIINGQSTITSLYLHFIVEFLFCFVCSENKVTIIYGYLLERSFSFAVKIVSPLI